MSTLRLYHSQSLMSSSVGTFSATYLVLYAASLYVTGNIAGFVTAMGTSITSITVVVSARLWFSICVRILARGLIVADGAFVRI